MVRQFPNRCDGQIHEMVLKGFYEGPLHYTPRVTIPLHGVWKPSKKKWRNVHNSKKAGLKAPAPPASTSYDLLADVAATTKSRAWMAGIDLTDAFYLWFMRVSECDNWGMRSVKNGEFFRSRVLIMGGVESPKLQQEWARVVQRILNEHGAKYCTMEGTTHLPVEVNGVYVDDFHLQFDSSLSQSQAQHQFDSVLKVLDELGMEYGRHKLQHPARLKEYVGVDLCTEHPDYGHARITPNRQEALLQEVSHLCDTYAEILSKDDPGLHVLDICGGMGTTLLALLQAGHSIRKYWNVEIDETARRLNTKMMAYSKCSLCTVVWTAGLRLGPWW